MEGLRSLYEQFIDQGVFKDAEKLLTHIDYYAYLADARQQGKTVDVDEKYYRDGYYDSFDTRGDDMSFDNGYVIATILNQEGAWLNGGEGNSTQTLINNFINAARSYIPYFGWLTTAENLSRAFKLKDYYEYNPGCILKDGDVKIYYASDYTGGYGTESFFRGNEWLYSYDTGTGEVEFGPNYFTFANQLDSEKSVLGTIAEEAAPYLVKGIYKALPK